MLSKKVGIDLVLKQFTNKRVLVRVDFNVPLKDGVVKDSTRILGAVPTLKKILEQNPKSVTLISHLGRPDGKRVEKHSLRPVLATLEKHLGNKVEFLNDCVGSEVKDTVQSSTNGKVFLLENLRFHLEEEGKGLDKDGNKVKADKSSIESFRKELTSLGDIFVNDAFGTAHRAHSSMVGINLPIRAAGYLMKKELDYLSKVVENPQRPYLVILGGAKVKDKIQLIKNLLGKVDEMIIGGGMAFTFLKRINNISIGNSLFDEEGYKIVDEIIKEAKDKGVKLHFPVDFVCGTKMDASTETKTFDLQSQIPDGWMGLDTGLKTRRNDIEVVKRAKTIFWNGPLGAFEIDKFKEGSLAMLEALESITSHGGTTIIGGGDTASFVSNQKGAAEKISHISTGGGASIELLEGKTLPGVEYLTNTDQL